jgi:rsbT co-antagonist protein RsbR
VLENLADRDAQTMADFAAFSSFIDSLGLYYLRDVRQRPRRGHRGAVGATARAWRRGGEAWDGVVAVPLVGTLDSARSQVVMERLLQTLVDTGSQFAILDITGVPAVDTQVAQHILKTVMAAQLMGARCVISGIRPQIAQTDRVARESSSARS